MREIKFRAWEKPYEIVGFEGRMLNWENIELWNMTWLKRSDYHFMQYTGLKDKSGKEIYEGDIVKCEQAQGLGFVTGIINYGNDERMEGWYDPRIYLDTRPFQKNGIEHCIFHKNPEIIGNIYENPDLLTNPL